MNAVDQALQTLTYWLRAFLGVLIGLFAIIENFLHNIMSQIGIPANFQSLLILVVAVLFIVGVLRAFGGVIRLLLVVFLILLVLHILLPNASF
jgi:hypothetical protein